MTKIYLSSTYSDLKAYREAVYHTLRQMRYDVLAMEDYVATDKRPLEKCLQDVATCDVYIGLFAWRYGYVPSEGNPEHKSITELEYRKATQSGKACLIFLLDEDVSWPRKLMDEVTGDGKRGERIALLRQELAKEKIVSFFQTSEQLAGLVGSSVHRWEEEHRTVLGQSHTSVLPLSPNALTLRALPLPTNSQSIQQRETLVKDIYALLLEPPTAAVVLTGMGGIGKSTLASLVLNHAERERRAGRGPFRSEPLLLRINENTLFPELAANIFAAVGKSAPDLSSLLPQNQAFALFNALNTADTAETPRLIILDQFENLLDQQTGRALTVQTGVGEFLDALNSQPCACRVLFTSRPRPHGARNDALASLSLYRVGGLDSAEGIALLRSQGVLGTEKELREAVQRCGGHALSLTFLSTLLQTYQVSLATLLHESLYVQLWEGEIAQNLLDRIFIGLSEPSRQLLCAFSVYREAVAIDAAQAIMPGTTKAQALTILGSLLEQHLIQAQITKGHYLLHPIVATYVQYHFVVNDEEANAQAKQVAHAKAAQYYLHVATTSCPPGDKRRHISDVQPFIEAVWQLAQAGQFQEAYELMERESLFNDLSLWGGNAPLLELCHLLLTEDWQGTQQQRALIYSNIASTSDVLGQKQEALQYYQQALAITREVSDRGGEGITLNNLGLVYDALGQKQEALQYYQQALVLHKSVQNPFMEGITLHNIGMVYDGQSRYEVALACILLAKALFERVQSPSDVDDEVQWIANLRKNIGEEQFVALLAQVEPRAEQIVEETLRNSLSDN